MTIRTATLDDCDSIHELTLELARFEKLEHEVASTPADFKKALSDKNSVQALVIDNPEKPGLAGYALYFETFSTFTGKPGLWLEDLYIRPEFRGRGWGTALLDEFLKIAQDRGCGRAEWAVLDWNEPAKALYRQKNAEISNDWRICRVTF